MDAQWQESFSDFGANPLLPFNQQGMRRVDGNEALPLRNAVRQFVPKEPGVYGMLDPLGRLVYVGKSKSLRNRLLSYFLPNNEEDKAGRIVQSTSSIVWETLPSDFSALLREQQLIRYWQPRFNVQGIPKRQQPVFVCLGRSPAEQLYTARSEDPKAICWVGPLQGATRANRAVEVLNRLLGLRDCSSKTPFEFTEQLQLFDVELRPGCIRHEIRTCLGPCIRGCSRKAYDQAVARAKTFLAGEDDEPVELLEKQLNEVAQRLHYEQAAVMRDDLRALQWLNRRSIDLAQARNTYTFVYPVDGFRNRNIWYLIRRGQVEGAIAAPATDKQRAQAKKVVEGWLSADNTIGTEFSPRPETLALVSSWFRNHQDELTKTFGLQLAQVSVSKKSKDKKQTTSRSSSKPQ